MHLDEGIFLRKEYLKEEVLVKSDSLIFLNDMHVISLFVDTITTTTTITATSTTAAAAITTVDTTTSTVTVTIANGTAITATVTVNNQPLTPW